MSVNRKDRRIKKWKIGFEQELFEHTIECERVHVCTCTCVRQCLYARCIYRFMLNDISSQVKHLEHLRLNWCTTVDGNRYNMCVCVFPFQNVKQIRRRGRMRKQIECWKRGERERKKYRKLLYGWCIKCIGTCMKKSNTDEEKNYSIPLTNGFTRL